MMRATISLCLKLTLPVYSFDYKSFILALVKIERDPGS